MESKTKYPKILSKVKQSILTLPYQDIYRCAIIKNQDRASSPLIFLSWDILPWDALPFPTHSHRLLLLCSPKRSTSQEYLNKENKRVISSHLYYAGWTMSLLLRRCAQWDMPWDRLRNKSWAMTQVTHTPAMQECWTGNTTARTGQMADLLTAILQLYLISCCKEGC